MEKYSLVPKKESERELFTVKIVGDSNDSDLSTTETRFTHEEFEEAVDELKNLEDNYSKPNQLEYYDKFESDVYLNIPSGNDRQCHTLVELVITYIDKDGVAYNVLL